MINLFRIKCLRHLAHFSFSINSTQIKPILWVQTFSTSWINDKHIKVVRVNVKRNKTLVWPQWIGRNTAKWVSMPIAICQTLWNWNRSPSSTPRFQIFIPTKIFHPHCLEEGRIILRCNLNFSVFLKGLTYGKLVFMEGDFKLIFTPDPCKIKKILPSVNGQKKTFALYSRDHYKKMPFPLLGC